MSNKHIDIAKSERVNISFMTNQEAFNKYNKGWGYSFVYSLKEIRDIYLTLQQNNYDNISDFSKNNIIGKVPYSKNEWNNRRVLEVLNSLINFGLIDKEYKIIGSDCIFNSGIGTELSLSDIDVFKMIYLNYFRFKEFLILHLDPELLIKNNQGISDITIDTIKNDSKPLYSFSSTGRHVDTFFCTLHNSPKIYIIPELNENKDKNGGLKRFWDVFISWGVQLGFIEKFNLNNLHYKVSNEKTIVCSYVLSGIVLEMPLINYVKNKYENKRSIDIADLVFKLCIEFRITIESAQKYIIDEYKQNPNLISLVRTSEVFVKIQEISKTDKILYPKYLDSYISHLIIRL